MSIEARFKAVWDDFTLDVDLELPARGVTAVFGPSGCGKTTLLRAVAGLDRHPGGYLRIGESVWQDAATFVLPHRRAIGYVFQESSLFPHLSVRRNLEYGARRVPEGAQRVALDRAIDLLGISPLLDRRPQLLSGGERQRAAIARALAVSPSLLLMDEPLASLDLDRKREIYPYLQSLHTDLEIPVIYVSHSRDEVTQLADHLVLLESGRSIASGALGSMLTRLDLPLAHSSDAESIIDGTVSSRDDEFQISQVESPAGVFSVIQAPLPIGSPVRLRIAARDVSLTLQHQSDTSILNIFPATVDEIAEEDEARVTVRLAVGEAAVLASVTRKSANALQLQPGKSVFAQVKSVAVLT